MAAPALSGAMSPAMEKAMGTTAARASPTTRNPAMTSSGSRVASASAMPPAASSPAPSKVRRLPRRAMTRAAPRRPIAIAPKKTATPEPPRRAGNPSFVRRYTLWREPDRRHGEDHSPEREEGREEDVAVVHPDREQNARTERPHHPAGREGGVQHGHEATPGRVLQVHGGRVDPDVVEPRRG